MNASLEYIADSLIIEKLAANGGMIVIAQDGGIVSSIASNIKNYVLSIFDKDRPISSIMSFLGPGILFKLGFPWMSVLYTAAEAFGFDWKGFWSSVGQGITTFVKTILSSGKPADENEAAQKVNETVANAFNSNFSGQIDKDKLEDLAKNNTFKADDGKFSSDLNNALELKKLAIEYNRTKTFTKVAGITSKLAGFFIKIISWVVKTALISLGFVSAAGAVRGLLGIKPDNSNAPLGGGSSNDNTNISLTKQPIRSLKISPSVSPEMFTVHSNDMSSVWMEHGDISNIDDMLISWVLNIYPQLKDYEDKIKSSSNFQTIVSRFEDRNKLSSGTGMVSVPRPYERKADIVSPIVNGFLSQNNITLNDNQSPGGTTI
jgi:hypothetical protein